LLSICCPTSSISSSRGLAAYRAQGGPGIGLTMARSLVETESLEDVYKPFSSAAPLTTASQRTIHRAGSSRRVFRRELRETLHRVRA
jgi:hypothetical protein